MSYKFKKLENGWEISTNTITKNIQQLAVTLSISPKEEIFVIAFGETKGLEDWITDNTNGTKAKKRENIVIVQKENWTNQELENLANLPNFAKQWVTINLPWLDMREHIEKTKTEDLLPIFEKKIKDGCPFVCLQNYNWSITTENKTTWLINDDMENGTHLNVKIKSNDIGLVIESRTTGEQTAIIWEEVTIGKINEILTKT